MSTENEPGWESGPPIGDLAPGVPLPPGVQPGDRVRFRVGGEIPPGHATVYPLHPGDPGLVFLSRDPRPAVTVSYFPRWQLDRDPRPVVLPRPPWWRRWWRAARRSR